MVRSLAYRTFQLRDGLAALHVVADVLAEVRLHAEGVAGGVVVAAVVAVALGVAVVAHLCLL